ncbi:Na+/H+ antiporter NhaA [Sphingomonas sp. RB56-2]|uniref:Na(+)/H(+) antiporter NhaA n=1 Tax=Sphingomonas brevis TaxID=2908206 RepID=A0ABT0SAB0_9SPHN|nr:Na+/H+ antiporter NhaA [Sphingomonas brevis]MCL6741318.1 Na+/H+ antiporter NhaA [Sphingomonas brevis]
MANSPERQQLLDKYAGIALIAAAAAALLAANGPLAGTYQDLLHWKIGPPLPRHGQMDLHHWVADGLMAVFFLLVGLEVKREWYAGQLSSAAERRLPIIAAIAGMALPAAVFLAVIGGDPGLARGWAIPAATDIAFAVGVLAILGRNAPASIKLLLVAIAIVDDIGAVLIIALFYTADLYVPALAAALALTLAMAAMGRFGLRRLWPFLIGFLLLWLLVLASGVHATISGVLAALTIPLGQGEGRSPLKKLEHAIHPWVMFAIVPIFGFASAGVALGGVDDLARPLPLAILAGLFLGKQLGIFGAIWAAVRLGIATRPAAASWRQLYGAAILCGIGFTMSLFIGALAFPGNPELVDQAKVGTLAGSLLSALAGYAILRFAPAATERPADRDEVGELFSADEP